MTEGYLARRTEARTKEITLTNQLHVALSNAVKEHAQPAAPGDPEVHDRVIENIPFVAGWEVSIYKGAEEPIRLKNGEVLNDPVELILFPCEALEEELRTRHSIDNIYITIYVGTNGVVDRDTLEELDSEDIERLHTEVFDIILPRVGNLSPNPSPSR